MSPESALTNSFGLEELDRNHVTRGRCHQLGNLLDVPLKPGSSGSFSIKGTQSDQF